MRKVRLLMSITIALSCASVLAAERPAETTIKLPSAQRFSPPDADNSGVNVRDKSGATQTPQKQTDRAEDRKLLAAVRRTVVRDKTLSTSAYNIKMVAKAGIVTLRGPVSSEDEKAKIEKLTLQVAGVARVENQLDVKTK